MQSCNLECVKKGKKGGRENLEFVGPVKIVLVDQSYAKEYIRIVWYAAMIGIAEMTLATVTTIAQFFSMSYKKNCFMKGLHAVGATIGLQACLLSGILVMNSSSGAAAPMRVSDRKFEHVCVQFCALLFGAVAAGSAYLAGFKSIMTLHSILGFVATGLALLTGLSGIFLSDCYRLSSSENESFGTLLYIHLITGIFACIVSSMCFVSGMTSDIFVKWLPVYEMYTYMVLCVAAYTTIIVYKPLIMIITGRRDNLTDY